MSLDASVDLLRQRDPDRLAALMTAPPAARPRLLTLYALAGELARAPCASAEPALAEIRLQWWIDALEGLPDSAGLHPILAELAAAWGADGRALIAIGEGQRIACEGGDFASLNEMLAWIRSTDEALTWRAAQVLGMPPEAEGAVRAQGRALGIASYLRHGGPRGLPGDARARLLSAGREAARQAAASPPAMRSAAPALAAGPGLQAALNGDPQHAVPEIARRWAALRLALTGRWKFSLRH